MNLSQFNHIDNIYGTKLDLVFSDYEAIQVNCDPDTLLPIDNFHPALNFEFQVQNCSRRQEMSYDYFNFFKADYFNINCLLNEIDWNLLFGNHQLELNVLAFYEIVYHVINFFVPKCSYKRSFYPPWFSNELICNIKQKDPTS